MNDSFLEKYKKTPAQCWSFFFSIIYGANEWSWTTDRRGMNPVLYRWATLAEDMAENMV